MDNLSPCQAIKLYCRTHCFTTAQEVKDCHDPDCPLFSRRLGKDPNRAKVKTPSQWTTEYQPGKTKFPKRIKPIEVNVTGKEKIRIIIEEIKK